MEGLHMTKNTASGACIIKLIKALIYGFCGKKSFWHGRYFISDISPVREVTISD
jgi:hypothetical protein